LATRAARLIGRLLAIVILEPFAWIAAVAAVYVLAPLSRFGAWLGQSLARLREWKIAVAAISILAALAAATLLVLSV